MFFGSEFSLWRSWRKVGANEIKDQMQQGGFASVRDFTYQKTDYKTKYFLEKYHTARSCLNLLYLCVFLQFQRSTTYWIHETSAVLVMSYSSAFHYQVIHFPGHMSMQTCVLCDQKRSMLLSSSHRDCFKGNLHPQDGAAYSLLMSWHLKSTTKDVCERRRRLSTPKMHLH